MFQGFRPVAGTICPSRAAAVVGPSRAPQGMKKGRRPRRRPRLKLSDKAGPDQCPVPGENALFPAQIAGFLAVSRPVPVYPVFLNYVVPVQTDFGTVPKSVPKVDPCSALRTYFQVCTSNQIATQRKRLQFGKEEQQNERILTFIKNRSKRYVACSEVVTQRRFELRTPCLKGRCSAD